MRPIARILYSSHFRRKFKKLDAGLAREVTESEKLFREDCFHSSLDTHKLAGKLRGFFSFSITRKYRILFQFLSANEVYFVDVDDHDMYR